MPPSSPKPKKPGLEQFKKSISAGHDAIRRKPFVAVQRGQYAPSGKNNRQVSTPTNSSGAAKPPTGFNEPSVEDMLLNPEAAHHWEPSVEDQLTKFDDDEDEKG